MNRFFVETIEGNRVALPATEAHHALHVLRLKVGDEAELFDGAGTVGRGRIAEAGRRDVLVDLNDVSRLSARPGPAIHLGFAVPKGKRLDWLLEKATELGAASLRPVVFERSVAAPELSKPKAEKWRSVCIAAAKQCGLNFLPEIHAPEGFRHFLDDCEDMFCLLGDNGPESLSLPEALGQSTVDDRQSSIVVGPEGGLTEAERQQAAAAGFRPVQIGGNTLRVETAAVAMLAALTALVPINRRPET